MLRNTIHTSHNSHTFLPTFKYFHYICNQQQRHKESLKHFNANIMNTKDNKDTFIELLQSTGREGVNYVIEDLAKLGFFDAPASAGHHLNTAGGLVQHSLNVYKCAMMLRDQMDILSPGIKSECSDDSVIIASLLHDVCKSDIYKRTTRQRKNALGTWEPSEGYKCSYKDFPIGHGEKSVIMLLCSGLDMTDAEMIAIRWHMGAWEIPFQSIETQKNQDAAYEQYSLCTLIHAADLLAARLMEKSANDAEDF